MVIQGSYIPGKLLEIRPSWKTPGNLTLLEIPPGFLRVLEKLLEF